MIAANEEPTNAIACTNVKYIGDLVSAYNYTKSIENLILLHNNIIFSKSKIYKHFFTCNSDANGVMKSNIRTEYELNLQLLESFIENKKLQDNIKPTVTVISDEQIKNYYPEAPDKMLDSKVLEDLLDAIKGMKYKLRQFFRFPIGTRNLKYHHFKEDVRQCFRYPISYIKEGQPERGFFWF